MKRSLNIRSILAMLIVGSSVVASVGVYLKGFTLENILEGIMMYLFVLLGICLIVAAMFATEWLLDWLWLKFGGKGR